MVTLGQKVEELVNQSPYLRDALSQKMINLSSLARQLRPQIESELIKDVSDSAIFMALQRYSRTLKPYTAADPAKYLGNLSLRSELFEITVKNSSTLMQKLGEILKRTTHDRSNFLVFTQGIYETTIVASNSLSKKVKESLKDEEIVQEYEGLTALSLQRLGDHIEAIGTLQFPLKIIAWQGISVIEIISTFNELMIIIRDKDVDRAVISVRGALQKAKTP